MFCSKCGTKNNADSNFCMKCGNSLQNTNTVTPTHSGDYSKTTGPSPDFYTYLSAGLAALGLIMINIGPGFALLTEILALASNIVGKKTTTNPSFHKSVFVVILFLLLAAFVVWVGP